MGDVKVNPFTPFQMTYIYDAAEEWGDEPWNATPKNCSETYDVSNRRACGLSRKKELQKDLFVRLKFSMLNNLTFFFIFGLARTHPWPAAASIVPSRVLS